MNPDCGCAYPRSLCEAWRDAELVDIMDYSLSPDREAAGKIDDALTSRIEALARYGVSTGAAAVLFTCSAFGSAIERASSLCPVPVLKPNEAMFGAAMAAGERVAMICPFAPAAASMEAEFREEADRIGSKASIETFFVPGAIKAVRVGGITTHNALVAAKAAEIRGFDAITLAHFSTARALEDARKAAATPVFASPPAAVARLRGCCSDITAAREEHGTARGGEQDDKPDTPEIHGGDRDGRRRVAYRQAARPCRRPASTRLTGLLMRKSPMPVRVALANKMARIVLGIDGPRWGLQGSGHGDANRRRSRGRRSGRWQGAVWRNGP